MYTFDGDTLVYHACLTMWENVIPYPRYEGDTQHWEYQAGLLFEAAGHLYAHRCEQAVEVLQGRTFDEDILEYLHPGYPVWWGNC